MMFAMTALREKKRVGSHSEFGFTPKDPIGKPGVPVKRVLWGDSIVGLSCKTEAR